MARSGLNFKHLPTTGVLTRHKKSCTEISSTLSRHTASSQLATRRSPTRLGVTWAYRHTWLEFSAQIYNFEQANRLV